MPKKIKYEKKGNKYFFDNNINHRSSNYISFINIPNDIGKEHSGKKVKITLEVQDL